MRRKSMAIAIDDNGWRGLPADILARVAADVGAVVADPAFAARLVISGAAPRTGTPAEFAAAIAEQRVKLEALQRAGAKPAP